MRAILKNTAIVAAAALALAACGKTEEAPVADANTAAEVNAADAMAGTTNDAMTNVDAAAGNAAEAAGNAAEAAGNAAEAAGNAAEAAGNAAEAAAQ